LSSLRARSLCATKEGLKGDETEDEKKTFEGDEGRHGRPVQAHEGGADDSEKVVVSNRARHLWVRFRTGE
jgi:hypothetical protein